MSRRDDTWTVGAVLAWTRDLFAERGADSPRLDAEVLVAHALGLSRVDLYTQHERPLVAGERERLRMLVRRRANGEPVAYLTGEREFWSLSFRVDERVLVPRPETEVLVEECLAPFRPSAEGESPVRPARVADVGTGSGAVAIVLAKELPGAPAVLAIDRSPDALAVAAANVRRHGLGGRIALVRGALLTAVAPNAELDLIAANLPYIPSPAFADLPRTVRDFEPRAALDGGDDGLRFVFPCVDQAAARLKDGGWLVLELGDGGQVDAVRAHARAHGAWDADRVRTDYSGRPRVLRLRRAHR